MATSGSVNYSVTRNDIINEALELNLVKSPGDSADPNDITSCVRTLEMMIKYWQSREIHFWKTEDIYLPLELSETSYTLGPNGDHATTTMVKTEVSTAASSGASTILVDSITGASDADNIGVELDGGDLQWTTINGAPSGSTITLTDSLTDDVVVDAHVYIYTTIINRPLFITKAVLHRDSGTETPIKVISRNKYKGISTKTTTGPANQIWYDPRTTDGTLYVWPTADTVKDYLILTARMPIEDFDASGNNPDYPQEWYLAIAWNLAVLISPKFGSKLPARVAQKARAMLEELTDFEGDSGSVYFEYEE